MANILSIIVAIVAFAAASVSGQTKNTFVSGEFGFSIEAPSTSDSGNQADTIVIFFLPASDGFAANVGIIKQKYKDSIEAYDKLSLNQFGIFEYTILNRMLAKNEVTYEYRGIMQGMAMHFYARAIKKSQYIYLVTATSLESSWQEQKAQLLKSINSFQL